jgi:hypothetical protein
MNPNQTVKSSTIGFNNQQLIVPTAIVTTTAILTAGALKVAASVLLPKLNKFNDKLKEF